MNITKIKGVDEFPESIDGTHDWYTYSVGKTESMNLYEAEGLVKNRRKFTGVTYNIVHFESGKVYEPFEITENIYVEKPIYNNGEFLFLVVDFNNKTMNIYRYLPVQNMLYKLGVVEISSIANCYNLSIVATPATLCQHYSGGSCRILWPEQLTIVTGELETLKYRDDSDLYFLEKAKHTNRIENVFVRDIRTGQVKKTIKGDLKKMPKNIFWNIQ